MAESSRSNQTFISASIEVREIVSLIQGKLCEKCPMPSKCSIFRVPNKVRQNNQKAFDPQIVSIGPFHHGKRRLQPMEKIKLWYLRCLLNRAPSLETTLECLVEAIQSIEQECRACYADEIDFPRREFIEMMVVDGCFILELLRKYSNEVQQNEEDSVFCKPYMRLSLINDLLLLENQLPWLVLACLFHLTKSQVEQGSLPKLVISGISFHWPPCDNLERDYILDCLRNSILGKYKETPAHTPSIRLYLEHIPSVTELVQAGVKFKVADRNNPFDITFKDGVMTIPPRFVLGETESIYRNLIGFEKCDPSKDLKITSHAKLFADLINTSRDVDFLKQQNILRILESSGDVASFFNRLHNDTGVDFFLFSNLYCEVNAYCRRSWNRYRAILMRDYFHNPWTVLSLIGAIMILAFSFYKPFIPFFLTMLDPLLLISFKQLSFSECVSLLQ